MREGIFIFLLLIMALPARASDSAMEAMFKEGSEAYRNGDYFRAAQAFRQSARLKASGGALLNLGISEWQRGSTGRAILAWEQAIWVDPFNKAAYGNLRFARKTAQLESPQLAWYEAVSSWLPANWWAWVAGICFWFAIGAIILPGIFRQKRATWHQAGAALGFTVFLLSLPAQVGVHTRSKVGFILQKDTPLRLTPTQESQVLTKVAAGEPARWQRVRGNYVLLRTNRALGWVEAEQFRRICQP